MPGHIRDLRKRKCGYNGRNWAQARWHHPDDPRDRQEKSFPTKKLAREWMNEEDWKAKHGQRLDPHSSRDTLAAVATEWQASMLDSAPKTRVGHASILHAHILPEFGERRIAAIDRSHIQKWVNELRETHKPNTVHNVFAVLRMVMAFAVDPGKRINISPCAPGAIKLPPKSAADPQPLTDEQLGRVIDAMPTEQARMAVLIAAYMGLRAGELWALRCSDVNLLNRELIVDEAIKEVTRRQSEVLPEGHARLTPSLIIGPTKTYQKRQLGIPEFLIEPLAALIPAHAAPDAFMFTDERGGPIRHNNFYKRVYTPHLPADIVGRRRNWHSLRHTCASFLIDNADMQDRDLVAFGVKEYLGHKNIQTTLDIYASMLPSGRAAVAASMDARYRAAQVKQPAKVQPLRATVQQ